ncbi:MAG: HD domain-containing protein [Myxococcales bacterium]|nr:HD domain-containing protein [Myxococcota bacterium]MDW8284406.1 HD domain-containing protein [Myxococcales bacterium]
MPAAYSRALDEALALAAQAHHGQLRKGSDVPYIQHPVHVALLLVRHGFPDEVVIAGVLHDVVEDTDVQLSYIAARFGTEVARLVEGVTERKTDEAGQERPWRTRKEEQLRHLAEADPACAALKAADALHNCQTTLGDVMRLGAAAWSRFKVPAEEQLWYYTNLAQLVRQRLGPHPLCDELEAAVAELSRMC